VLQAGITHARKPRVSTPEITITIVDRDLFEAVQSKRAAVECGPANPRLDGLTLEVANQRRIRPGIAMAACFER